MKLSKVIPATIQINTDLIKKGEIFEVEDTHSCNKNKYIVLSVNEKQIDLTSLTRGEKLTIKATDIDRFMFTKMKLVKDICNTSVKEENKIKTTTDISDTPIKTNEKGSFEDFLRYLENFC